ncbi:MAG: cytochrome B6 [Deltaproteobacteria bacterium HGW-Deltaproteobacteria-18]|jgi:formate dehydrogenase subunit gamma|nr:MAG: cytochrome B6 [Deltaproteobacteria bacterium HGW-Deltaproteobacteria-20]PKN42801.1 MAG: cytochrome B6 [Deltaproteobacteria bacterium HGW-Deltaproteobacteria-18]
MSEKMIHRHTRLSIFMHWFNAFSWFALLLTGLGLIKNEELNPVGAWLPDLMRALFGGGENLLLMHQYLGLIWAGAFLAYILLRPRETWAFLKEVFAVSPASDIWLLKMTLKMALGRKGLERFGLTPDLPPQGFYNFGQKLFAQASVVGGAVIVATGLVMFFSTISMDNPAPAAWSRVIHYLTVGLVFAGLLVHIFMAAISREERPAFMSMFTGNVSEHYARHHHSLWYAQVAAEKEKDG